MNKKEFNIGLSIKEHGGKTIRGIYQNDTGVVFNIQLLDGNRAFDYRGFSQVVVDTLLPDGNTMYSDGLKTADSINPEDGMVCFTLPVTHTAVEGMHYMTIHVYGSGHVIATARINYYVDKTEADYNEYLAEMDEGNSRFTALQQALALTDTFNEEEKIRRLAEEARKEAEIRRQDATNGLLASVYQYMRQMSSMVTQVMEYYRMVQEIISSIGEVDGVTLTDVVTQSQIATISGGTFTTVDKLIKVRTGNAADIPTLAAGEMGYATDTAKLYIGTAVGNVCINQDQASPYIIAEDAPADTSKLWVDTTNNAVHVYNSATSEWIETNTGVAVFA